MKKIRLYTESVLKENFKIALDEKTSHYLKNVLKLQDADNVYLFNGKDGEWQSEVELIGKTNAIVKTVKQTRIQGEEMQSNATICFPPIRNHRIKFLIEKVTELGAKYIQPIVTENTNIARLNIDRLKANSIEAAEQSQRLSIPEIKPSLYLEEFLKDFDNMYEDAKLFFLDERKQESKSIQDISFNKNKENCFIIGPEGGFTENEFELFEKYNAKGISLGDLILRTETAAISILSFYNFSK